MGGVRCCLVGQTHKSLIHEITYAVLDRIYYYKHWDIRWNTHKNVWHNIDVYCNRFWLLLAMQKSYLALTCMLCYCSSNRAAYPTYFWYSQWTNDLLHTHELSVWVIPHNALCLRLWTHSWSPPGQSLCLRWKHTQKSVLIPDRTHLWIHPACFTLHECLLGSFSTFNTVWIWSIYWRLCFVWQTRSLLSVFEEDAGTLTNYTNQLLQSMQRVFGAQVHTHFHIDFNCEGNMKSKCTICVFSLLCTTYHCMLF